MQLDPFSRLAALRLTLVVFFAQMGDFILGERPNILWITSEDNGISWVSCYGGTNANTTAIDQLAKEGFRYTNCFDNAAVLRSNSISLDNGDVWDFQWNAADAEPQSDPPQSDQVLSGSPQGGGLPHFESRQDRLQYWWSGG